MTDDLSCHDCDDVSWSVMADDMSWPVMTDDVSWSVMAVMTRVGLS